MACALLENGLAILGCSDDLIISAKAWCLRVWGSQGNWRRACRSAWRCAAIARAWRRSARCPIAAWCAGYDLVRTTVPLIPRLPITFLDGTAGPRLARLTTLKGGKRTYC